MAYRDKVEKIARDIQHFYGRYYLHAIREIYEMADISRVSSVSILKRLRELTYRGW